MVGLYDTWNDIIKLQKIKIYQPCFIPYKVEMIVTRFIVSKISGSWQALTLGTDIFLLNNWKKTINMIFLRIDPYRFPYNVIALYSIITTV